MTEKVDFVFVMYLFFIEYEGISVLMALIDKVPYDSLIMTSELDRR